MRIGLFTPGMAFEVVARKQIDCLRDPSTKLVGLVTEELFKMSREALSKVQLTKCQGFHLVRPLPAYKQTILTSVFVEKHTKKIYILES